MATPILKSARCCTKFKWQDYPSITLSVTYTDVNGFLAILEVVLEIVLGLGECTVLKPES